MNPKETGIMIISIGMSVLVFGTLLLMDRALMISGNLLIIVGIVFLTRSRVLGLLHPQKLQGSVAFTVGVLLLIYGLPALGFLLESIGLFLLLRDSLPTFRGVLRSLVFGKVGKLLK